jgi:hypothetical protein
VRDGPFSDDSCLARVVCVAAVYAHGRVQKAVPLSLVVQVFETNCSVGFFERALALSGVHGIGSIVSSTSCFGLLFVLVIPARAVRERLWCSCSYSGSELSVSELSVCFPGLLSGV